MRQVMVRSFGPHEPSSRCLLARDRERETGRRTTDGILVERAHGNLRACAVERERDGDHDQQRANAIQTCRLYPTFERSPRVRFFILSSCAVLYARLPHDAVAEASCLESLSFRVAVQLAALPYPYEFRTHDFVLDRG